jgi:hypothetical protein
MAIMTATATRRAAAATTKPKSPRILRSRASARTHSTPTAGKEATAAAIGAELPATVGSDCISDTWVNQMLRTIGSIMAKGPARHAGSSARNTAVAARPQQKTPPARAGQPAGASIAAASVSPRVATTTAAAELIAIASQAVPPQCVGPTLMTNATATLAAALKP